jgi:cytochrome b subunit of formate dehydrogenase
MSKTPKPSGVKEQTNVAGSGIVTFSPKDIDELMKLTQIDKTKAESEAIRFNMRSGLYTLIVAACLMIALIIIFIVLCIEFSAPSASMAALQDLLRTLIVLIAGYIFAKK